MIVKTHKTHTGGIILAVCDSNILGKKYEDNHIQLDLTSGFYQGDEKSEEEVLKLIKCANHLNLVGENTINFAKKNNLIDKEKIIKVQGIPHAQVVIIREENTK